jgi:transcriptional regulator with XRE-family HTH domain
MNIIKELVKDSGKKQKEIATKLGIKENTFSTRLNKEVQGTIEWSLEVAKELNVKSYSIVKNGYEIKIKRK